MTWAYELFTGLSRALEGSLGWAALAAFGWGVLSILLSPCHLASIPLVVGYIDQQGRISTRRAFAIALLFSLGILATIALIGVATAAAGRMLGDIGGWGNYGVAVVFFAVGLHLLDIIRLPLPGAAQPGVRSKGLWAAFILGLVFGLALGPCTFAYMAPMLAIAFKLSVARSASGVFLLLMYGLGHCGVIVLAGTSYEWIERYLKWNQVSRGAVRVRKICGALVLLGGLWMIYTAP